MEKKQLVTCDNCPGAYSLSQGYKTRPVEGLAGVVEAGLECPHCGRWTHIYYLGEQLKPFKQKLDDAKAAYKARRNPANLRAMNRARRRYQAEHDRFNTWVRKQTGARSPNELLKEQERGRKRAR